MSLALWSFVLAIVGIVGMVLAGQKRASGWAVGLGSQVLWIVYAITTGQPGFALSAVVFGFVCGYNWWRWSQAR